MLPRSFKELKVETLARAMKLDAERHLASLDHTNTIVNSYSNGQIPDVAVE